MFWLFLSVNAVTISPKSNRRLQLEAARISVRIPLHASDELSQSSISNSESDDPEPMI